MWERELISRISAVPRTGKKSDIRKIRGYSHSKKKSLKLPSSLAALGKLHVNNQQTNNKHRMVDGRTLHLAKILIKCLNVHEE